MVMIQKSRHTNFIHSPKGFHRKILKYFACGDFLLLNKSSLKMQQTFPVDRSSLFEVLAGPGPVCVPITNTQSLEICLNHCVNVFVWI